MGLTAKDRTRYYRERHEVADSINKYQGTEGVDYVECKICEKRGLYIDARHLRTRHSISKEEYINIYPNVYISSQKKINTQVKNATGNTSWLGKKLSIGHRRKISLSKLYGKNPFSGKSPTKEVIEKAKETRKNTLLERYGVTNSMYLDSSREAASKSMVVRILSGEVLIGTSSKGHFFSDKNNREFFYRSSWELEYMKKLEDDKSVTCYEVEPFSIKYEYSGIIHRYIPDFLVNNMHIVEIKPKALCSYPKTISKFNAAKKYANKNGYTFKVITQI